MSVHSARRGFTLLEMIISVAISSITIAAAVGFFTVMNDMNARTDKVIETSNATVIGMQAIGKTGENAGLNFQSRRIAVQVHDNITASAFAMCNFAGGSDGGSATCNSLPMWTGGLTASGIVPGTDMLEFFIGVETFDTTANRIEPEARLQAWSLSAPPFMLISPSWLLHQMSGAAPGTSLAAGTGFAFTLPMNQPVLLGRNSAGQSCMFRLRDFPNNQGNGSSQDSVTGGFTEIREGPPEFGWATQGYSNPPPAPCGVTGMELSRLERRVRYLVYHEPNAPRTGLYMQQSGPSGYLGRPELLVPGVEDLQAAPVYGGAACPTAANGVPCRCNSQANLLPDGGVTNPDPCIGSGGTPNLAFPAPYDEASVHSDNLLGLDVVIQSRGKEDVPDPSGAVLARLNRKPDSSGNGHVDDPGSIYPLGIQRVIREQRLDFVNFNSKLVSQ